MCTFFFLSYTFFCAFTVEDIYPLDFKNPEGNSHGIFAFKVDNIRSADHSFLYDKVKILLTNGVTDLSDISRIKGTIDLGGHRFHLSLPSVPEYLTQNNVDTYFNLRNWQLPSIDWWKGQTANLATTIIKLQHEVGE